MRSCKLGSITYLSLRTIEGRTYTIDNITPAELVEEFEYIYDLKLNRPGINRTVRHLSVTLGILTGPLSKMYCKYRDIRQEHERNITREQEGQYGKVKEEGLQKSI